MTTPTSQRRSLGRSRPSLNTSKGTTASSPALSSYFASSKPPPLPVPRSTTRRPPASGPGATYKTLHESHPRASISTIFDGHDRYSLTPTTEGGSSPFTMNPQRSGTMRTAGDDRNGNQNLGVGDLVDVPGGMHGTIKFIGEVKGKKGVFAGVELAREWAARGKNDGDVEGWATA